MKELSVILLATADSHFFLYNTRSSNKKNTNFLSYQNKKDVEAQ